MLRKTLTMVLVLGLLVFCMLNYSTNPAFAQDSDAAIVIECPNGGEFVSICSDLNGFGAIDEKGDIYLWYVDYGAPPADLPPIVQLSLGNQHAVALDGEGEIYYWGNP